MRSAIWAIAANPEYGEPLQRELDGLRKYRVRRFRIVYAGDQKARTIRLMAVAHRRYVYEELTERIRHKTRDYPFTGSRFTHPLRDTHGRKFLA